MNILVSFSRYASLCKLWASAMALAMCLIITVTTPTPTYFAAYFLLVLSSCIPYMYYKRNDVLFKASVYDSHTHALYSFCSFLAWCFYYYYYWRVRMSVCASVCVVMRDPHRKRIIWFQVLNEFRVFSLYFRHFSCLKKYSLRFYYYLL